MSLRIPLTKDQTLQVEFHEVERRLRRLEKSVGKGSDSTILKIVGSGGTGGVVNLQSIYERLTILEQQILLIDSAGSEMATFGPVGDEAAQGLVPSPGTEYPPTGMGEHVLVETGWGFPFRGLVQVTTSGDGAEDVGEDRFDILASLGINGGMSVDEIVCRDLSVLGVLHPQGYLACCEDELTLAELL